MKKIIVILFCISFIYPIFSNTNYDEDDSDLKWIGSVPILMIVRWSENTSLNVYRNRNGTIQLKDDWYGFSVLKWDADEVSDLIFHLKKALEWIDVSRSTNIELDDDLIPNESGKKSVASFYSNGYTSEICTRKAYLTCNSNTVYLEWNYGEFVWRIVGDDNMKSLLDLLTKEIPPKRKLDENLFH